MLDIWNKLAVAVWSTRKVSWLTSAEWLFFTIRPCRDSLIERPHFFKTLSVHVDGLWAAAFYVNLRHLSLSSEIPARTYSSSCLQPVTLHCRHNSAIVSDQRQQGQCVYMLWIVALRSAFPVLWNDRELHPCRVRYVWLWRAEGRGRREGEVVLFSLLKRPQSFHLQQDTDLPVNREETGKDGLLSLQWDKRSVFFSCKKWKACRTKTQTIAENRAVTLDCWVVSHAVLIQCHDIPLCLRTLRLRTLTSAVTGCNTVKSNPRLMLSAFMTFLWRTTTNAMS